jgi:antitoxin component HigA of HigAB toxin-antitoxin module
MKSLFEAIVGWFSNLFIDISVSINELPDFMIGNFIEILGILFASLLVAVVSTLYVDKKREIQKVKARVLDMRLEQYNAIREFVEVQNKTRIYPDNVEAVKSNLEKSGLSLEDNESCYSSHAIDSEKGISETLEKLENLTMKGLYIIDDDVLGMLLQIKIYIMNLNMFSVILHGYFKKKEIDSKNTINVNKQIESDDNIGISETINQISDFYFHHLSILLNNEYQKMIEKLQKMVIVKASKPKFERKEKNYRKIRTRRRLQEKALDKTILKNKFPQLIHALASVSAVHDQETEDQQDIMIKEFFEYAIEILEWHDKGNAHRG